MDHSENSVEVTLAHLRSEQKALIDKRERLRKPLLQVEEDLNHINGVIALLERKSSSTPIIEEESIPISRLRGLTQLEAIVVIAKSNNGVVKAQDAKRLMIRAGLMKATKNATNITHNTIIRSERFDRIGPGEFRLKQLHPETGNNELFHSPVQ